MTLTKKEEIKLLAQELFKLLRKENLIDDYTLTAEEKAKQLHISLSRLYKIKDKYPHRVIPGTRRIFFK